MQSPAKIVDPGDVQIETRASQRVRISRVLVAILVVWAIADVVGRLGPINWLHVLPEHIATRRPGRWHPFIPNLSIVYDPWVGETATTANLAPTETRAPVHFGTDELGFRKTPGVGPQSDIDLVIYGGASFTYGGGLSDEETFSAAMTRKGLNTYNGGHFWWDSQSVDSLDWLLDQLHKGRKAVLLICWEDSDLSPSHLRPSPWKIDRAGEALLGAQRYRAIRSSTQFAKLYADAILGISPLEVLSIRAFKRISNDRILPNPYKRAVIERTLPTGKRMLFLDEEVKQTSQPPGDDVVRRTADYVESYARRVAGRGLEFYVLLLPNRYTVYGPLIDGGARFRPDPYINRVEKELARRNISVLNAYPVLNRYAPTDLMSGRLSFYREDHHWTALGVERVADATATFIRKRENVGTSNIDRKRDSGALRDMSQLRTDAVQ